MKKIMIGSAARCSIVIRTNNEAGHIGRLLEGIQHQTIPDIDIVVVDSGSTDATIEIARSFGARVISILPQEFTFGRSLNLGIQHATNDLVVIASAHVYPVYPDWLEKLLEPFGQAQTGLTYGKQRGAPSTYFSEHQIFARWFPDDTPIMQTHPFCNNANAAIRRSLWEQRPYDETLSGLEDLEWANWLLGQGHRVVYCPEAEIIHVHNESPRKVYNRYRREAMAFKRIFPQEQFNVWDLIRLYLTNASSDLWHAARAGQLGRHAGSILWFRWMQFWGTYQGYHQSGPLTWRLRETFYYPQGLRAADPNQSRQVAPIQYNDRQE